jgi:hypothetical protein
MEQIIEVQVDVPDDFKFVGYQRAKAGQYTMHSGELQQWPGPDETAAKYLVFDRIERHPLIGKRVRAWDMDGDAKVEGVLMNHEPGLFYSFLIEEKNGSQQVYRRIEPAPETKQWYLATEADVGAKVYAVYFSSAGNSFVPPDLFQDPDQCFFTLAGICPDTGRYVVTGGSSTPPLYFVPHQVYVYK